MKRIFTKRIACRACTNWFTITSAASKFCKNDECIKRRRKADRLQRKQALQNSTPATGSGHHLARALRTGE